MADQHNDLIDEDQPLLDSAERKPVITGIVYLLAIVVALRVVTGWLVIEYTHG